MSQPMTPSVSRPFGLRTSSRPADVQTGAPPAHGYRAPLNEGRSPGHGNLRTMNNEQREAYARLRQEQVQAPAQYTQSTGSAPSQMYQDSPLQSPAQITGDNGLGEMVDDHMSADGEQFTRVYPVLSRVANHHAAGVAAPQARESSHLLPPTQPNSPQPAEQPVTGSSSSSPSAPAVLADVAPAIVLPATPLADLPSNVEILISGAGAARTIRIRLSKDA